MRAFVYHEKGRFRITKTTAGLTTYREIRLSAGKIMRMLRTQQNADALNQSLAEYYHGGTESWTEI